ncbi:MULTISPECIES: hypothetical protein [Streptomyces]|uniref:PPE family domain-containing protein n=1 Tax=Streptomyces ramulosus TaxID=47762 RepID=A0ABW1FHW7_9ACTN
MPGTMDNDGNKAYAKQIDQKHRTEGMKQFDGYKPVKKSTSDFHHHGINALRKMLENASPEALERSGDHWRASADRLAGEDGRGGIRKAFADAVDHASKHWSGTAADAFRRESVKVLEKIDRTYLHARKIEAVLIGSRSAGPQASVAHSLREAKKAMSKIEDPGKVESAFNSSGDDSQFHKDMANPKMDAKMALELNRDKLSLSKERQVEAVIVMEELAANYRAQHQQITPGPPPGGGGDWPTKPDPYSPPAPVNMPITGGTSPTPGSVSPHVRGGGAGIRRDALGNIKSLGPVPQTDLDSVHGGLPTPTTPAIGSGFPGGGGGSGSTNSGGGIGGMGVPGLIGMPGAGGMRSGTGAGIGGARPGAVGSGVPGAGKGKPGGPAGGLKQGGAGLHRSRGGAQGGPGMAGAAGKGKKEKKAEGKERPDYLVEDEETWTSQRNVAPRVIE